MSKNTLTDLGVQGSDNINGYQISDGSNHVRIQSRSDVVFEGNY